MKRLILYILAVFAITIVVVGCGSSNTSSSGNTELEGTWTETVPGTDIMPAMTLTFTFSGNNWASIETTTSATVYQMSGTFTLDSTANPKTLDLYITTATLWSNMVGTTLHGIYQLSGTNLAIANGQGGTRPTSFTTDNTANLVKQ